VTAGIAGVTLGAGRRRSAMYQIENGLGAGLLAFEKDFEFPDKLIANGVQSGQAFGSFRSPAVDLERENFRTACMQALVQ
jgi:hypothetical protein